MGKIFCTVLTCLLMTGLIARAESVGDIRLKSGKTLKAVVVLGYSNSSFMAKWEGGMGTVAYADLPDSLRPKFEAKRPQKPKPAVPTAADEPKEAPSEMKEGVLALGNIDMRALESMGDYVKYAWKAEIMNGTAEPRRVDAEIKLFDKDGFELDHDFADTVYVPAGKRTTATGTGMVKSAIWDAAKSFQVKLSK